MKFPLTSRFLTTVLPLLVASILCLGQDSVMATEPVIQPLSIAKFLADPERPVVYAINQNAKETGQVLEINPLTRQIVRVVNVGKEPSDLDLTESGDQLVVVNTTEPSLSRIDLSTFTVTETIPLSQFSNGNDDVGGHVKCGKGSIVYYVDEQWGPRLRVFDTATRSVFQTFSSQNGSSPNTSNNNGYGDIGLTPDRSRLFGWRQYGPATGSTSTHLVRFSVNADGTLSNFVQSSVYDSTIYNREPDTPILFSRDGSRMVIKERVVDQSDLNTHPVIYPDEIHSISPGGEIAIGSSAIYAGGSGEILHTLAATSSVQAVLPDYSALVYFNKSTKTIAWLNLVSTLGANRLGLEIKPSNGATVVQPAELKWLPTTGITRYQVYLGTSRSEVEAATVSSPLYQGEANAIRMALSTPLTLGQTYYWRAAPINSAGQPAGPGTLYSFTVSRLALSRSSIEAETVQGVTQHLESIALESTTPQAWTATKNVSWIRSVTAGGTTPGTLTVTIDASSLNAGIHQGEVVVVSSGSSVRIPVSLKVHAANFMIAEADRDLPYVYVVSQESITSNQPSFLLRVDTDTNKIVKAVPVGKSVTSLSVHYAENRIYVTNWNSGLLRTLDRNTLEEVRNYQYAGSGGNGTNSGDAYVVAAGRAGRFILEQEDQWINFFLIDSATGEKLATSYTREGGGVFEPTGRFYYHGENNSSGATFNKYDTDGDVITELTSKRVESAGYNGSRLVAISGDGSRVFWNGGVFDPDLNILMQFNEEIVESTYHGEILFTNTKAINGSSSQTLATLPVDTKIQAVSGDQKKLYLFKGASMSVVDLSTIAVLPPRGLTPGIADAATVIGTAQELSWSLEATALSYDVYFGATAEAVANATKESGEFLGTTTSTRWTGALPELGLGSTYFWRVDMNGFSSTSKGNTWSFGIATVDVTPRIVKLATPQGSPVPRQTLTMSAAAPTAWTASTTTPWITLRNLSGTTPGSLQFDISSDGLSVGPQNGAITLQAAGKSFTVPIELTVVTFNLTKLVPHPDRPVVYGINTSLAGEGFSQLLEIDASSATILRTLPIGFAPTDADLDPLTERLYVSNWGYSQTRVIDVATWTELPSLNLGDDVYKLEITPNGRLVTEGEDQWVSMRLWDAATGEELATQSSIREGDGQADPTGAFYYHSDNNSSGAVVAKYDIADNSFVKAITGPQIGYGSRNLILSGDGKRLFWLGRTMDEDLNIITNMPSNAEVYATNHSGDLAVGESAIWWSDSATPVTALPFLSKIAAFSANDAYLLRFDPTTKSLSSTSVATITDLPGANPRPGQVVKTSPARISWSPVEGATSYRFFIAADAAALAAMTSPVATLTNTYYDLPSPLSFGRFHSWRVDAVTSGGTITGKVNAFGIEFPQAAALPQVSNGSSAIAASLADRHLLLGFHGFAQVYDFDPASGSASPVQEIKVLQTDNQNTFENPFGQAIAMDAGIAIAGFPVQGSTVTNSGAAYLFRPGDLGYWNHGGAQELPNPVTNDGFGRGVAASGNLLLLGTNTINSAVGRVAAYITEPEAFRVQIFGASDGVARDGFGSRMAMEGGRAIIAAPGRGASYNRIPCLYAFTRSTTNGRWVQTQKISIPGATSSNNSGQALALSGNLMATRGGNAVVVYTRNQSQQWVVSATIDRSEVTGSSFSFGSSLALIGDQLFIGDTDSRYAGDTSGAVFTFRQSGSSWVAGPVIAPTGTGSGFGSALSARDHWLSVAGGGNQPARIFRISTDANQTPRFVTGLSTQVVAGRAIATPVRAEDADGNAGLVMELLKGPAWLSLVDQGNGQAVLSGTPASAGDEPSEVQIRVRDAAGAEALRTYRLSILAETDLPVLTTEPVGVDLGVGQEMLLLAAVSGTGPFQWQWYFNRDPIPGATSDRFALGEVTLADAGSYRVRVSNVVGEVVSAEVTAAVRPADRFAGDWPTFGGSPAHTGRHPAALETTHFIPSWSKTVQEATPLNRAAIADGRAFVVPIGRFARGLAAQALDLQTGEWLWSFPIPSSNSSNPPSVYNGRVYFQRGKGTSDPVGPQLFSLNAETGAQLWAASFGAQWESYEAPAVSDLGAFINGGAYGGVYGFNLDGSQRFFQSMGQYDNWTPTISSERLFTWVAGLFEERNPLDGTVRWSVDTGWDWRGWSMNTVSAVTGDSAAVISTTELVCIDLPSASIRWRNPTAFIGSPAIGSKRVFAIKNNAVLSYALADGSPGPVYQTTAEVSSNHRLIDQPIIFNDRLAISNKTRTWIFNLEDGQLLQTLNAGGRLSYSDGYLLAAGNDGILRTFRALHFNANLAGLSLSDGAMLPGFDTATTEYIATVPFTTESVTLTPTTELSDASVTINGLAVTSGTASAPINLEVGNNTLTTQVTAEDGITTMTYVITLNRLPLEFVFNSGTDIPVTANGFSTGGYDVNLSLRHEPVPGSVLTMVDNTGLGFMHGRFGNLAQGQKLSLEFEGQNYDFVANYFGGSGNDLVLQWAATELLAWGGGQYGQLGDGASENHLLPSPVDASGVLAGKTITAVSSGYLHTLALCSDGTLAAWGYNAQGQLGNGGTAHSSLPEAVDQSGALAGRSVVAISSGPFHNLALCADGTIAAWGYNNHGQLGHAGQGVSPVPVLVDPVGALAGKNVVAVSAGAYHSLARCDDGSVVGWGYNDEGQLGDGTTVGTTVPVALDMSGALAGKRVSSLSAGQYHTLALCTDGTLVSWGYNKHGQLGNGSNTMSEAPVEIGSKGVLDGKTVTAIRAGRAHSLALGADGTLASWGDGQRGQLGTPDMTPSLLPLAVDLNGLDPGQLPAGLTAGGDHNLLRFTNGSLAAWGDNSKGQLGDNSTITGPAPFMFDMSAVASGARFMFLSNGAAAQHSVALLGLPAAETGAKTGRSGVASGAIDPDALASLFEYAFGPDPRVPGAGQVPQGKVIDDSFVIRFMQPAWVEEDVIYGAEWSASMLPGTWTDIPDTGIDGEHIFSLPLSTAPKAFMRLKVDRPPSH